MSGVAASIANKKFGLATVKHSGCGVVATYNAMITLGDPKPFDDILNYYNSNPSYRPFWGLVGMSPAAVESYFINSGYDVIVTSDLDI